MFAFRSFLRIQFLLRNLQWDFLMKNSFFSSQYLWSFCATDMHLSLDIDRKWCTVHFLVLTWEMFCGQYVTLANAQRANRELSFKCTQTHCDFAKTDLSFCKKIKRFLVWFDHNMSLVDTHTVQSYN